MADSKYKTGDKFIGIKTTFFIHYVADTQRIVLRWRFRGAVPIHEQTMSEIEIDDILEQDGAVKS